MRPTTHCASLLAVLLLSACVSVGVGTDSPVNLQLRLHDDGINTVARLERPLVAALLLQPMPADALADTVSIPYSRQPHEFAFYQFANWTERPVRQLPRLLQRRLESRGVADAVGLIGDPLKADWLLTLAIDTLHHDVSTTPGRARLALTAELVDRRSRTRVARQQFVTDIATASADSSAAAAAMSTAVTQSFDALVPWLESALKSSTPAR